MKATVYAITPSGYQISLGTVGHQFQHGLARAAWQKASAHLSLFPKDRVMTGGVYTPTRKG